MTHRERQLQSAMEYLMTYGWAILIIAVVLGALFQLGIFNASTFTPKAPPGSCHVFRPNGPMTSSFINLQGICNGELPQYVAKFNGAAYISASDSQFPSGSSARTISMWINTKASGSLFWHGTGNCIAHDFFIIINANGHLQFESGCDDTGPYSSTPSLTDGSWHQLIIDYSQSATTLEGCVDSTCQTLSLGGAVALATNLGGTTTIGKDIYAYFTGDIANVQVYNTSLSSNEISALYTEGIGGAPVKLNSLVAWWPLNGDTKDYSGNNNNGAASGVSFTSNWESGYSAP